MPWLLLYLMARITARHAVRLKNSCTPLLCCNQCLPYTEFATTAHPTLLQGVQNPTYLRHDLLEVLLQAGGLGDAHISPDGHCMPVE